MSAWCAVLGLQPECLLKAFAHPKWMIHIIVPMNKTIILSIKLINCRWSDATNFLKDNIFLKTKNYKTYMKIMQSQDLKIGHIRLQTTMNLKVIGTSVVCSPGSL